MSAFFDEQAEQSQVKSAIVTKYFWAWAKVIVGTQKKSGRGSKIGYIDLFAGPGRYKDGAKSTPVLILEQAIADADFRQRLVSVFNDKDDENTSTLKKELEALEGYGTLKYPPKIHTSEVGDEMVKLFSQTKLIPTLFFVDPWGYKGLSLKLINSVMKDWGCECIFFFNYNRINMGLANELVKSHLDALFGEKRADKLREKLEAMTPDERELSILEEICQALKEMGGEYVLPFGFKNEEGTRTKHHLIFVSKHRLGYEIMKGVMAKESSSTEQGVPTFQYSPADKDAQPMLFELARPLDDLEGMLLDEYAGKTMTTLEVYEAHNVGRRYVSKNYKDVLAKMFAEGKVTATREKAWRKGTFPDDVKVAFPQKTKGKP